jgi:uncharacterized membrane protein YhaH (DUF805 family)
MSWYIAVLKKYAVFSGRASRQEYWMFMLVNILIMLVLSVIAGILRGSLGTIINGILVIYEIAVVIPSLSAAVRRLHDTDRSGWWVLIGLVPFVGVIVAIVFMVLDGTPGSNRFGANPKGIAPTAAPVAAATTAPVAPAAPVSAPVAPVATASEPTSSPVTPSNEIK